MADTGWVIAGTGTDVSAGTGTTGSWNNPNNITTATTGSSSQNENLISDATNSFFLHATNFGFVIPAEAEINGIEARISARSVDVEGSKDNLVRILSGGAVVGQNKATHTWPTGSFVNNDYGSSADMWSLNLTPAQINATNFGLRFQARVAGKGKIQVSSIWMRIHYEETGGNVSQRIGGTWRTGQLSQRVAGVHRSGPLFQRIAGVWRS